MYPFLRYIYIYIYIYTWFTEYTTPGFTEYTPPFPPVLSGEGQRQISTPTSPRLSDILDVYFDLCNKLHISC